MFDSRSGELLSAGIGLAISIVLLNNPTSLMAIAMGKADVLPEWSCIAILCCLFSICSVFIKSVKLQTLSRFLSGCIWGSVLLLYGVAGQTLVIFWTYFVLFLFDIIVVVTKGRHVWTLKNHS